MISRSGKPGYDRVSALRAPLVLDLDGDDIELIALDDSEVHVDYDGDGFAERIGWVSSDDGILVYDGNENGQVDGIGELFGSPTQYGFVVLQLHDSNRDGKIDASDESFGLLRVWRVLDQDGEVDAGEMQTLEEAGIASIDLDATDVSGANEGHDLGFQAGSPATT